MEWALYCQRLKDQTSLAEATTDELKWAKDSQALKGEKALSNVKVCECPGIMEIDKDYQPYWDTSRTIHFAIGDSKQFGHMSILCFLARAAKSKKKKKD